MSGGPTFRAGDAVVVKAGVMCPDKPSLSLAGWQGWATEIQQKEGMIEFDWDSATLRTIPDDYIRESILEGLKWQSMVLDIDEVSLATPRDTLEKAQALYEKIMSRHAWDHLSDLNPGIGQLLDPLGKREERVYLQVWEKHLKSVLQFPFEARREEQFRRGPVEVGEVVEVRGIVHVDDTYGIFVAVRLGKQAYTIPLCDLEATDSASPNYQPLKDYVVWFANR
jgi:hypothetical protein